MTIVKVTLPTSFDELLQSLFSGCHHKITLYLNVHIQIQGFASWLQIQLRACLHGSGVTLTEGLIWQGNSTPRVTLALP